MQDNQTTRSVLLEMLEDLGSRLDNIAGGTREIEVANGELHNDVDSLNSNSCTNEAIEKIKHALVRMDNGQYGICQACGEIINDQRLAVAPFSSMCLKCATQAEGC